MDSLIDYDFHLPEELIATTALANRGASRLMVLPSGAPQPHHDYFASLPNYLNDGDVLVINNTKVMKARIEAFKKTGGRVEVLLVRPLADGAWAALINGKGPFIAGTALTLGAPNGNDEITVLGKNTDEPGLYEITSDIDLHTYLDKHGELPLPPYFRRRAQARDLETYQTIYAKTLGAVAAPTAGLHFTDEMFTTLKARGVAIVEVTLHVGPGTFLPIRTNNIAEHRMHEEFFTFSDEAACMLNRARAQGKRIIPVGTTSMRVIEHIMHEARERGHQNFFAGEGKTRIFIRPGYQFLASSALITNFHLPRSTLLLLVSALAGRERILRAYEEAIAHGYRFFSYGDACFLEIDQ